MNSLHQRGRRRLAGRVAAALSVLALPLAVAVAAPAAAATGTGTIAVCLTDSQGQNVTLADNQASYRTSSIRYVGAVGESGCRESEVGAGTAVDVWVGTEGTRSHVQSGVVPDDGVLRFDFYTTKVTIQYPGQVAYGGPGGDTRWFKQSSATASRELLSDGVSPTMFRLNVAPNTVARTPVSWPVATGPGRSVVRSLVAVQVRDGAGNGLPGVQAQYNTDGGSTYFWVKNADGALRLTGEDGLLAYPINGYVSNVRQRMSINHSSAAATHDTSAVPLATFGTTNVTMNYNHKVRYLQGGTPEKGQVHFWFDRPSMELFPGSYSFEFQVPDKQLGSAGEVYPGVQLAVEGSSTVKTAAAVRLTDSTRKGLRDGSVHYYRNGAWNHFVDSTDGPGGTSVVLFDGAPGTITFSLDYEGARQQLAKQDLATDSVAHFQTVRSALRLVDHAGQPLEGGTATFYSSSWRTYGTTDSSGVITKELLPVKHSFRMSHLGSLETVAVAKVDATPVEFQTGLVESGTGTASTYYTNAWRGFPEGGVELLPSRATFRFGDGTAQVVRTATPGEVTTIH